MKYSTDPDLDYNLLIRPWKSRLGILYVDNHNLVIDIKLVIITIIAIIKKDQALKYINSILINLKASPELIEVCQRNKLLKPSDLPQ